MNLYTYYSNSHQDIYENYFLKTFYDNKLENNFDLIPFKVKQRSKTGNFDTEGFNTTTKDKINILLDAVHDNWNDWFIFSDSDVQFFKDFYNDIVLRKKEDVDIIAQQDFGGTVCTGFFMAKGNERTEALFKKVYDTSDSFNDQMALNSIKNNFINWDLLPLDRYFSIWKLNNGDLWRGEKHFNVPKSIFVHHANYTIGIENKIELLEFVKNSLNA